MSPNIKRFLAIILLFLVLPVFFHCDKKHRERVPNIYVNFVIDLGMGQYSDLQLVGGWVYVKGGYRGIILYRNSLEEVIALDRTSTYKPESIGTQVIVEPNNLIAADTVHGMRYYLMDGTVVEGPVSVPLKRYRSTLSGMSLHVYN